MRAQVFEFTDDNNLKVLGLITQIKNLESLFNDVTI